MATSAIGKRRAAAKEDGTAVYRKRRKEIAEAAVRVFNRLGLAGASISAVAAELHTDRASLYYYISSKEELFDEILRELVEHTATLAKQIQAGPGSARDKLTHLIVAMMTVYADNYPLMYIYVRENLGQLAGRRGAWAKHMRKLNRDIDEAIIAIVAQGYADGSFRDVGPARIVAFGVLGMLGWTHRWFHPSRSDVSAEQIARTYAEMVIAGLEAPWRGGR
jgi:TetR/AcrR family transcriptional regulator, cholesterol catabolism regulator